MSLIQLQGVGLAFPHKTCFSDFSATIEAGQHIAITGDNGAGKSSLLRMLYGAMEPGNGQIQRTAGLAIGYVGQEHSADVNLSGGQRVNHALSQALASAGDLLLLDEPTNHLDAHNRQSLTRMLKHVCAGIVLVTHDTALLDQVCDTVWHIGDEKITVFHGRYADYVAQREMRRNAIEQQLLAVKREQQRSHTALMKEQERASHARARGLKAIQQSKWATIKSPTKLARGTTTSGSKQAQLKRQREELIDRLEQLPRTEIIVPQFHLPHAGKTAATVVQITDGAVAYNKPVLQQIQLTLARGKRLLLAGCNGSGKSTLAKAIMRDPAVVRSGTWVVPGPEEIGYLDQHYASLHVHQTVMESLRAAVPGWTQLAIRRHLSDFLFRGSAVVDTPVAQLSGGEKARLALACIAAKPPQLLILDEVTNNLDQRMRAHVLEILRSYSGTMIVISHDEEFLQKMGPMERFVINSPSSQQCNSPGATC